MVIMLASARQERPLFRTEIDQKMGKCTLRHLVRSPQVEVEQSPLNSTLEPAHSSDRTWACGLVLPGLCKVALLFELRG